MDTDQRKRRIAGITSTSLFVSVFVVTMILAYWAVYYPARTELGTLVHASMVIGIPVAILLISMRLLSYSTNRPLRVYTGIVLGHDVIDAHDVADMSRRPLKAISASGESMDVYPTIHYPKNWRILVRLDDTGEERWFDHHGVSDVHERFPLESPYNSREAWSTAEWARVD